jgi:hypothetical protein
MMSKHHVLSKGESNLPYYARGTGDVHCVRPDSSGNAIMVGRTAARRCQPGAHRVHRPELPVRDVAFELDWRHISPAACIAHSHH